VRSISVAHKVSIVHCFNTDSGSSIVHCFSLLDVVVAAAFASGAAVVQVAVIQRTLSNSHSGSASTITGDLQHAQ
jgi:hypothetical protein